MRILSLPVLQINLRVVLCLGAALNGRAACLQESPEASLPSDRNFVSGRFARGLASDALDAASQTSSPTGSPNRTEDAPCGLASLGQCLKDLGKDQAAIFASPFKIKAGDLKWLVPFAGITTGLIETDRISSREATRGTRVNTSTTLSDAGLALAGGSTVGFYLLGVTDGNRRLRETGVLGGEAMLNSLALDEGLKYAFQRERPSTAGSSGRFFQGFSQDSFPSAHATLSFAFATVLAHEYPGWLTKTVAYGGASAISLARVTGKEHFPSDVFVGAVIGSLIGQHVYRAHHDEEIDYASYGTFVGEPRRVSLASAGSTYVALDSWIYPAVERLVAMGILRDQSLGLRPWTRTAVAGALAQAKDFDDSIAAAGPETPDSAASLYSALTSEFAPELALENGGVNESIRLESVYSGFNVISGTPLNDSYHFGQTIINNFGRPYQQGFNSVSGFTSRAESGHFFFYARGEYQDAPSAPALPDGARAVIAQVDENPLQPAVPVKAARDFRLLDTYAGVNILGHQVSIGKQSLWWGSGEGGAFIFSNNAEPINMLRINRPNALYVPLISKLLGPIRYDNFFGKLSGHNFPADPFVYGQKFTFQPTKNLELGFSRTAVFAGQGKTPLTFGTFKNSFFSFSDVSLPGIKGTPRDPGDRHSAFDFSYRLPFMRNWATLYADSIVHDDASPIDAPRRAAIVPGIYISHFPRLTKLDLRVESGYTDIGALGLPFQKQGRFIYWEAVYHDAYTNKSNLFGSWIGRQGKGTQVWSHYWLRPSTVIEAAYRNAKLSPQFIPGGGTQNDYSAGARTRVGKGLELSARFQYEQWNVPALAPNPAAPAGFRKSDFSSSVQITYWPNGLSIRKAN
jgi:hypothetical protein